VPLPFGLCTKLEGLPCGSSSTLIPPHHRPSFHLSSSTLIPTRGPALRQLIDPHSTSSSTLIPPSSFVDPHSALAAAHRPSFHLRQLIDPHSTSALRQLIDPHSTSAWNEVTNQKATALVSTLIPPLRGMPCGSSSTLIPPLRVVCVYVCVCACVCVCPVSLPVPGAPKLRLTLNSDKTLRQGTSDE
jgi:hypothetical protein